VSAVLVLFFKKERFLLPSFPACFTQFHNTL